MGGEVSGDGSGGGRRAAAEEGKGGGVEATESVEVSPQEDSVATAMGIAIRLAVYSLADI
jgi:hypothetical protein